MRWRRTRKSGERHLRLSAAGMLLVAVTVALWVLSVRAGRPEIQTLALALTAGLVVSAAVTRHSIHRLRLSLVEASYAAAGDPVKFHIQVTGGPPGLALARLADGHVIPAPAAGRVTLAVPSLRRGAVTLGAIRARSPAPFGLWWIEVDWEPGWQSWVYPRPAPWPMSRPEDQHLDIDEAEVIPLRQGQRGRIHWPSSSRGQGYYQIAPRAPKPLAHSRWLDYATLKGSPEERLSALAAAVLAAGREEGRFGLRLPGQVLWPDRGAAHERRCLRALAFFGA